MNCPVNEIMNADISVLDKCTKLVELGNAHIVNGTMTGPLLERIYVALIRIQTQIDINMVEDTKG